MKRRLLAIAAVGLLAAGAHATASAATILEVDFGSDAGFTADNDGVASDRWERRALGDTPFSQGSSQQAGMIFYGNPRHSSAAPTITLDAFDFTGYTDLQLEISLAATDEVWEDNQVDRLVIQALGVGVVDRFLPVGDDRGTQDLQSVGLDNVLGTSDDGALLDEVFQDFVYDLGVLGPLGVTEFQVFAQGTGSSEKFGIDTIRITGTAASPMPEPTTSLLLIVGGLVVGGAVRRKALTS